ncbi:efflux RND transporter permease subunit [Salipiger bermudensis]|uniref:Efflux pump membrane transporter n=1 Tax=Salipiger bermudensis (strain DSM 26914 / JCM 13377 / KCTC 12554 / HTCC2601) TaxID=314265 RepID=Q0FWW1_SALBH|nr:multidrug efflux RND transporter permease subunit [Salipiger bermudensis]EAU48441.1 hydrophobe/amphiphile efflux-1 family protein [Salipiger bermudensis HTCC2601]
MFSSFFIDRPKFALVISLVISLFGLISYLTLPVEKFPDITPPEVNVSTAFLGASATTVEESVAAPLEEQINGVDDMMYMSSSSADSGLYTMTVTFAVGTDPDIATVNVQNRVSQANSKLPADVVRNGVSTSKSSSNMLLMVALYSEDGSYDELFLSNYANINLRDPLARVPGVGRADVLTDLKYAMRIWMDPERLAALGMTPSDFVAAIQDQNAIVPAGTVGGPPGGDDPQLTYTVTAQGLLDAPEEFEQIVLRTGRDGAQVTVGDVARVELGSQFYTYSGSFNGVPSSVIGVYQAPGANAVAVSEGVISTIDRLAANLPEGMDYAVTYNNTDFIESSIDDVIQTLLLALVLVLAVVYIFLGSWRATLIPAVAIPVSLIGAFAVMQAAGMSLNTISLFALVLAIGIVVDDAIVVVENTERLIAEGLAPKEATRRAMREVTAPVIATTLVLLAVFVPVTFMPGITGRLYSEFAITISGAVLISSLNALTLSPALCSLILKPRKGEPRGLLLVFEGAISVTRNGYVGIVSRLARVSIIGIVLVGVVLFGLGGLSRIAPTGFIPNEDQGTFAIDIQLPDAATLARTEAVAREVGEIIADTPGVKEYVTVNGFSILSGGAAANGAFLAVVLDPWDERSDPELHAEAIRGRVERRLQQIPSASIITFSPPPIPGLGSGDGVTMQIQQTGAGTPQELDAVVKSMIFAANQRDEIARSYTTFRANVPQLFVDLDRERAKALGVNVSEVFTALQAYLGSIYVNDFNLFGRVYQVKIQAEGEFRDTADDIANLYVRSQAGEMVPLRTLVTVENTVGPMNLPRYNLYRSAALTANTSPGTSTGEAIALLEQVAAETLPPGYSFEWTGSALQEQESGGIVVVILGLAVIFAYLFLVAQYESWTMPLAILLTVPLALLGAYVAVLIAGRDVNLYTQIGMIMLIGLGAKNAILIVEYAMHLRASGRSIFDAGTEAARLRFRAVMMTALSFLLGVVPLVIASGAGAGSQQAIGIAVFGGMAFASTFGVILTPILYVALQSGREKLSGRHGGAGHTAPDRAEAAEGDT